MKIDLKKWTDPKDVRPAMRGIFHDNDREVAVATDSHSLIISKPDYVEHEGSVIIDSKGNEIQGVFPNYAIVFNGEVSEVDFLQKHELKTLVNEHKLKSQEHTPLRIGTAEGEYIHITARDLKRFLTLPLEGWGIIINGKVKKLIYGVINQDENYRALIMVCREPQEQS